MDTPISFDDRCGLADPLVVIDIGNCAVKFCRYDDTHDVRAVPLASVRADARQLDQAGTPDALLAELFGSESIPRAIHWCVASVWDEVEQQLRQWTLGHRPDDSYWRLSRHDIPLTVSVHRPDQVGIDRLLAACAADRLKSAQNSAIVVDVGTAVTVDLVSADGRFRGGTILPGPRLQLRALHENTDRLPALGGPVASFASPEEELVGQTTEAAIRVGVRWGLVGSVSEIVRRIRSRIDEPAQLFVTGGDASLLDELAGVLDCQIDWVPDLVPRGILLAAQSSRDV